MRFPSLAPGLFLICLGSSGLAQSIDEADPPPKPPPAAECGPEKGRSTFMDRLPEETRERFRAAREKALEDPKLQALQKKAELARRDFFKAMREKMLQIDPSLADIVRKRTVERKAWKVWRGEDGYDGLNDEERETLLRVMEKVDSDPTVEAAKKKRWEANSPEERKAATEEYRKALREAMTKVDPTIAPVLDKLDQEKRPPPNPPESPPQQK